MHKSIKNTSLVLTNTRSKLNEDAEDHKKDIKNTMSMAATKNLKDVSRGKEHIWVSNELISTYRLTWGSIFTRGTRFTLYAEEKFNLCLFYIYHFSDCAFFTLLYQFESFICFKTSFYAYRLFFNDLRHICFLKI